MCFVPNLLGAFPAARGLRFAIILLFYLCDFKMLLAGSKLKLLEHSDLFHIQFDRHLSLS